MFMKGIINDDFLLQGKTAKELYHNYAKNMPIIDYHCHLSPELIAEDYKFTSIGELMLAGDHYKWRAIRSFGIEERLVTGDGDWKEKFCAFAKALEYCIGNPLYHWTHLELARYFGIDEALTAENAEQIYDLCQEMMSSGEFTARRLIERSGVEVVCTTDDPADTLEHHEKIANDGWSVKVLPTFRPDKAIAIYKDTFLPYIKQIGVNSYAGLKEFFVSRIEYFHAHGCRLADHGLDFIPFGTEDPEIAFNKALRGEKLSDSEIGSYMTDLILLCAREYAKRDWCMQIHVGALRNNNTRMYKLLGPDTGYDSIADTCLAQNLSRLMDVLDSHNSLPKTILYSLNPGDNYVLATLMGCFQTYPYKGKIQLGSGWWFNDQMDGMKEQLKALGNLGVLGCFVGMLTDSRSFISYPRHEYFRRILCNLIGDWVDSGMYPANEKMLKTIIEGISYNNAKNYFNF